MSELIFIGGGARSGKSRAAVERALTHPEPRVFIATAEARDDEMRARIEAHKQERDDAFDTHEAPHDLCAAIRAHPDARVLIIDCLTLWLSNLMFQDASDAEIEEATARWIRTAQEHKHTVIVVANEVGQGIVPGDALSRRFRDLAGRLNQQVAAAADRVEVRFFGLSLTLKADGKEVGHAG